MSTCKTSCGCHCHLKPLALGLSLGIIWGLIILAMGLIMHFALFNSVIVSSVGTVYVGEGPTIMGTIIGALLAFVHAFIKGFLIAWLYNCFAGCCKSCETGTVTVTKVE